MKQHRRASVGMILATLLTLFVLVAGAAAAAAAVPDVWDPGANPNPKWVNGNIDYFTEGEVAPARLMITDVDGAVVDFTVCLDLDVASNGHYGFTDTADWNTTVTPGDQPPNPANLSALNDGFRIENGTGTLDSVTFLGESDGGAGFECLEDYQEWLVQITLPSDADGQDETAIVVFGVKIAKPGDAIRSGGLVPPGLGAGGVNGTFQLEIRDEGREAINFKAKEAPSTLIIDKVTDPAGSSQLFDFTLSGDDTDEEFQLADGTTPKEFVLEPGDFVLTEENVPAGWDLTGIQCVFNPNTGSDVALGDDFADIDLGQGDTITCIFTNTERGSITIVKDAVPDGDTAFEFSQDIDVSGNFTLSDPASPSKQFSDVKKGSYTVAELVPTHWNLVDITCDSTNSQVERDLVKAEVVIDLAAGDDVTCTFKNEEDARLRVFKYNDLNMNGNKESDEPGLQDWEFKVYDANMQLIDSKLTGPNGYYTWYVPSGMYTVCELLQSGWVNTEPGATPNAGEVCYPAEVLEPGQLRVFKFGNYEEPQLATLRVRKYEDLNKNGQRDTDEPYLEGWTMNVYDDQGALVDSQVTDQNGWYVWQVPAADYTVCEELKSGWVNTQAGNLKPGTQVNGEVCSQEQTLEPGADWTFLFGNYKEEPPGGFCPSDDDHVGFLLTEVIGVGQGSTTKAYRTRKLVVPDYKNVDSLYGQLAAVDVGQMRFVRFRYPDKSYVQIKDPTSPAFHTYAVNWWGDWLEPANYIKGQFYWKASAKKSPRAFVLWPTYNTDVEYANVFAYFDESSENHVYWDDSPTAAYLWYPEQTQILTLPTTQEAGADILVQVALVDNNDDNRPVILTVSANGVSIQRVIFGPNKKDTLNLETFLLKNVPAGTDQVEIHLLSPDPGGQYPAGGDSVAMIGAAASYLCEETDNGTPEPTAIINGR